jgi:hypothetical protein
MVQVAGTGLKRFCGVAPLVQRLEEPCVPVQWLVELVVEVVDLLLQGARARTRVRGKRVVKEGRARPLCPDHQE